jgi:hypothetical protein
MFHLNFVLNAKSSKPWKKQKKTTTFHLFSTLHLIFGLPDLFLFQSLFISLL